MIEVRNLVVDFPIRRGFFRRKIGYTRALHQVSFSIFQGEILGLCGESGSGKTTLARCLTHLLKPNSGTILLNGQAVDFSKAEEKKLFIQSVQIVFQDPLASLNPRKTIAKNLQEPLVHGPLKLSPQEAQKEVLACLEKVGLQEEILQRYPEQFSGGQQQRICLARALSFKPKLIICDEILSALDLSLQLQILTLLKDLREKTGVAILFISHDLIVLRNLCERVVVMYLGEVMEKGKTEALFSQPFHPYTKSLIASLPENRSKKGNRGVSWPRAEEGKEPFLAKSFPKVQRGESRGCVFYNRCPDAQISCSQEAPPYQKSEQDMRSWRCIWNFSDQEKI